MVDLELLNADGLDESILNAHGFMRYSNADGDTMESGEYEAGDDETTDADINSSEYGNENEQEYEDEDNTDSDSSDEEGVDNEDLPRFRTLVRNKKLELKAQYGKARIVFKKKCRKIRLPKAFTERECSNLTYPCPTLKNPLKTCKKEVCANIPKVRLVDKNVCIKLPKRQWGWRKKWREFKKSGGLAQLRLQAKGLAPIPSKTTTSSPTTTTTISNTTPIKSNTTTNPKSQTINLPKLTNIPKSIKSNNLLKLDNNNKNEKVSIEVGVEQEKFLGMPKNIGIGVAVIGGLALGFLIYKKIKS